MKRGERPLTWCVIAVSVTNLTDLGEIYEIYAVSGVDNKSFHTKSRPSGYLNKWCPYKKEDLPEENINGAGLRSYLARYDVIICHNAFYAAPLLKRYLPTKEQRREAGSVLDHNVFACSLTQLDWGDACCKKLSCLSPEHKTLSDIQSAKDRCYTLIKTLKRAKIEQLCETGRERYNSLTPIGYVDIDTIEEAKDNGFVRHGAGYVKYITSKEASHGEAYPMQVASAPIPRHHMYVNKLLEKERG